MAVVSMFVLGFAMNPAHNVHAVGPDASQPYILINSYLSSTVVLNGDTLHVKARVDSNFPITRGVTKINGVTQDIPFQRLQGSAKSGFWVASWKASGLVDKEYTVTSTFFDSTGHSYSHSARFTDPIAGRSEVSGQEVAPEKNRMFGTAIHADETIQHVNSVKVYLKNTDAPVRVALYSANKQLLWQSNVFTAEVAHAWHEIPIQNGSPQSLENLFAGKYWLVVQSAYGSDVFDFHKNPEHESFTQRYLFNAYPIRVSHESSTDYQVSAYMIYNERFRFFKQFTQKIAAWFK